MKKTSTNKQENLEALKLWLALGVKQLLEILPGQAIFQFILSALPLSCLAKKWQKTSATWDVVDAKIVFDKKHVKD